MIFVVVIYLISCVLIASFCSMNSRKNEREKRETEERKNTLLMISDNFIAPDDPESSSLRGISSESVFSNAITNIYPPNFSPSAQSPTSSTQSNSVSSQ
ncbi:hypothetical protein L5515_007941 [Caenorhabditis briggsae]|uniref:Uncharacterized protein n=2 Tax=Caenorhabditis TaxID=6237 RepID=A0AAE9A5T3_CAEBR|nr:hypothetical protein B9Z55_019328 [Caenorhabditis nigoni]ULT89386.1 hypothetical protein L3Y34_008095 [Caenorhabditis briggsae]UMM35209.1 hypothetical protein L5515_007941 [Caenorhabditis briggsae]